MKWPTEFTLPEAHQFCQHALEASDGRCCTMGHFAKIMTGNPHGESAPLGRFLKAWNDAADEVGILGQTARSITDRNDLIATTMEQLALAFHRAWERLGYEITE